MPSFPEPRFPNIFDSTMISTYLSCPKKFWYEHIVNVSIAVPSIHLHAGGTWAKGLETLRVLFYGPEQLPLSAAVRRAMEEMVRFWGDFSLNEPHPKDLSSLLDGFLEYVSEFPPDEDRFKPYISASGDPAVEFSFALPIDIKHPETGEPLLYAGRFDMLATNGEQLFVFDDKTTGSLGSTWARQWRLRGQFTGYVWGAKNFGYDVKGAVIRGAAFKKTGRAFAEAIVYRPEHLINEWYETLCTTLEEIIRDWKSGKWKKVFADACASYGNCPFVDLCESPQPERWLTSKYIHRIWEPLADIPVRVIPWEEEE